MTGRRVLVAGMPGVVRCRHGLTRFECYVVVMDDGSVLLVSPRDMEDV